MNRPEEDRRCEVCGKVNATVRGCCYIVPGRQEICNACYVNGRGDHPNHKHLMYRGDAARAV